MFKKDLGIVICNFNKVDYLRDCLKSIFDAKFDDLTYDVIVVDNASTDGSEDMVKKEFSNVILLQTGSNLGGSGGFARGMQYVLDNKYRYLSVLDNDTKVDPYAFIELKNYLDKNNDVGVVGSTILKMDEPKIIQEMGAKIEFKHLGFILNYNERILDDSIPSVVDCDYVPACCFMTRYEILSKIGVFNPNYFIYWDDIDWCTRVKNLGKDIHAISASKVWHKGGAKLATNTFPTYYFNRNLIEFFIKNNNHIVGMAYRIASSLAITMYFSGVKDEFNQTVSMIMGIDDMYAGNLGAQWNSIFPRIRAENKLYNMINGKNIAIITSKNIFHTRSVIKNIIISNPKKLTIIAKNSDKNIILDYFKNVDTIEYENYNKENYDFVIQAVSHVRSFKRDEYEKNSFYLDPFSNYIVDEEDIKNVNNFNIFYKIFMKVMWKVLIIKFEKIKKDLLINEIKN